MWFGIGKMCLGKKYDQNINVSNNSARAVYVFQNINVSNNSAHTVYVFQNINVSNNSARAVYVFQNINVSNILHALYMYFRISTCPNNVCTRCICVSEYQRV